MKVKDLMNTDVVTVQVDQPVSDLFDLLQAAHVQGAPVVDAQGVLVGFVSQEDVMFGSLGNGSGDRTTTVGDIMTSPAMSVAENASVEDTARMMWRFRIHHMPVLKKERLVGIVSALDFCRLAAGDRETDNPILVARES